MDYKIIDIEGIGDVYAPKLIAAGIKKVSELLEKCAAPKGRKELAEETGISEKLILRWTNHADLFRIKGVGPQFAELLEAAGVDTVKEFRHRVAANLQPKLEEVNAARHICGRVPALIEVERMIALAKELEPKMTY
jgi:predicted flap endonuclease-1-like 5' DNA nuclease